jgi:glutathione synthase/RimK-type ligase-like ATP-grasp enzyme
MPRIGLLGPADRAELVRLAIRLEERGAEPVFLDSRHDPAVAMTPRTVAACGEDLSDLRGCYVVDLGIRKPFVPRPDGLPDEAPSRAALDASRRHLALWNAVLERLARQGPVVNPVRSHDLHSLKPWEMAVYARQGLPAPATLATSDPAALREPPLAAAGAWVRKGLVGGYGYTEVFTPPADDDAAAELLGEGPLLVQERVEGDNLRAYVLDGEVLGAAVVMPARAEDTDSRRETARVRRVELPSEAAAAAIAAARRWGMVFAAVDFMVEARSGRHLILECNSAPFFVNFEKQTGVAVADALAGYLVRPRRAAAASDRGAAS